MGRRWNHAMVTGASSGLGAALARVLAEERTDLVLVARRAERLEDLAGELRARHGLTVEVRPADLTDPSERELIERRLRDTENRIDLLVNNAGLGTGGAFTRSRLHLEQASVDLMVSTPLRLIHAVLPGMVEHGGAILNISSVAAFVASPWGPTYAASKMFEVTFADALSEQLRGTRASITVACPGFMATDFDERSAAAGAPVVKVPKLFEMSADRVARLTLDATERGAVRFVPGRGNRVLACAANGLPAAARRKAVGAISRLRGGTETKR